MAQTVIVTGSAGLVGSACVRHFSEKGFRTVGIDNNMRAALFGNDASSWSQVEQCYKECADFNAYGEDIRNGHAIHGIFKNESENDIAAVIHTAAQPSHDWAASNPIVDFDINARGTLNLLMATREHCPKAAFVFCSTNKVYGDRPNYLPLIDNGGAFEWDKYPGTGYFHSEIDESMPVDQCKHSLFGCSKLAADMYVQEFGRYFGMNTVCFRAGCLTGPAHAGAKLHGFLAYLVRCAVRGEKYQVIGYGGKQVRDNLHADDLADAFGEYVANPKPAAVYNIGGGRANSCSVLEAVALVEEVAGVKMELEFIDEPRSGDHKWWISDCSKFQEDYPNWSVKRSLRQIVEEIVSAQRERSVAA